MIDIDAATHGQLSYLAGKGKATAKPTSPPALSLTERLAQFDLQRHGGEAMSTARKQGAEQC